MAKIDRVQEVSTELLVPYANNAKKHRLNEHRNKMERLHNEIKHAKGLHRKDLIRQYNRMVKELRECEMHLRGDYGRKQWQRN